MCVCVLVETKKEGDRPPHSLSLSFPHLVSVITLNELNQLGDKGTNHFLVRVVDSINPYTTPSIKIHTHTQTTHITDDVIP